MNLTLADIGQMRRDDRGIQASGGGSALARFIEQAINGADGDEPRVTAATVRGLPAAWYSICKIAGHIGTMPLNLYWRPPTLDPEIATWHAGHKRVSVSPSALVNPAMFRETVQHHALLHGNGRSYIVRNDRYEPAELIILHPTEWIIVVVAPEQTDERGIVPPARKYHVNRNDPSWAFPDVDVLHIAGLSDDGIGGIGVVDAAKQALGIAVAQQTRTLSQEKNGARLRFLLKAAPGTFATEEKAKEFLAGFNEYHSGANNADRVGLLRGGMDVVQISQTNQDAQAIEGRRFSRQDVALLFQIESMLGDGEATYASDPESRARAYIDNCLRRWMTRWEEECRAKLLTQAQFDSPDWYFRFDPDSLLRGTTRDRYGVYQIARQIGVLSANDIRVRENMPRRKDQGGDSYDNPSTTAGGQSSTGKPASEPAPQPSQAAAKLRDVVARNLTSRLLNVERQRIEKAATSEANFCAWLSQFVASFADRVKASIRDCGGSDAMAAQWSSDTEQRVLAVAGTAKSGEELATLLGVELAKWGERVESLADQITGGSHG